MKNCCRIAVAATLAAATTTGCDAVRGSSGITGKSIRYQVEYNGSPDDLLSKGALSITYSTNDGPREQRDVQLPWTKTAGTARPGFTPSVRAQFNGFGTIVCRIVADSKVVAQRVSPEEPYPIVECSL